MDYLPSGLIRLTSWLRQTIQGSPSSSSSFNGDDVVEELRKLEGTLMRITAFLRDAEEREVRDESVKLWLRELKTISYQADDLLDEYRYELLRRQVEERRSGEEKSAARISGKRKSAWDLEVCISTTPLLLLLPDDMLDRIKKIRERFDEIAREREANIGDHGMDTTTDSFTRNDRPILCYVCGLQEPSLNLSSVHRMTEAPFLPRERLLKHQQYFQNIQKHTYLKGSHDKITSIVIPIALTVSSLYLIGRGIYNMSYGIGKKE
ncbi:hypothetical protein J5N97_014766 [Dioscorea zingiberensis]|uniref:Disease resistance N-terminal domain-containing protein n=1 Tax=Dioscorea zingiberensis TaxID=325984 RepID=A0A9D5HKD6_9LILI|nr:hypothetical protein J5N97_014766 [Dioscorea zingiberensis]